MANIEGKDSGECQEQGARNAEKVLGDSEKEKQANTKEDLPQSQAALEKRWSRAKMKRNMVVLKPRSRVALRRMSLGDTEE